jgi:HEPN domain-containing protein
MSDVLLEWIAKAEGDFHTALREFRARTHPNYDAVCFHAQQCIEKYLKALLLQNGLHFSRTHDLEILLNLCLCTDSFLEALRPDVQLLTQYAVSFRYPGEAADKIEAKASIHSMKTCRETLLLHLKGAPNS